MKDKTARVGKGGRTLRTTEERHRLVDEFKASGQGMAAFCQQRGVRLSTFWRWAQSEKYGRRKAIARTRGAKAPVKFAEVQMAVGRGAPIEVELAGVIRIRVQDAGVWPVVGGWMREVMGC